MFDLDPIQNKHHKMKKVIALLVALMPLTVQAQVDEMV